MRGPWALTDVVAAFTASWRDSNCTNRAGDHRNKGTIKIKTVKIKVKMFSESILPATMASDSASRAQAALASSLAREEQLERPRGGSQAGRFPELPQNNGPWQPSTLGGSIGHHRWCTSQRSPTTSSAQRQHQIRHWRACRPWEEDEDCHSRRTNK